jgi:ankyrin repeat protein
MTALLLQMQEYYANSNIHAFKESLYRMRDPNTVDQDDCNLLHFLTKQDREESLAYIRTVLNHPNFDINHQDSYGYTPFAYACFHGHPGIVDCFLNHPNVEVNKKIYLGFSPLILACLRGWTTIVAALLKNPKVNVHCIVDPAHPSPSHTAFVIACNRGNLTMVDIFLKSDRIDVNHNYPLTGLMYALHDHHRPMLERLLKEPRVNVQQLIRKTPKNTEISDCTAFLLACVSGFTDGVILFLQSGRITAQELKTGYRLAKKKDDHSVVELLTPCLNDLKHYKIQHSLQEEWLISAADGDLETVKAMVARAQKQSKRMHLPGSMPGVTGHTSIFKVPYDGPSV